MSTGESSRWQEFQAHVLFGSLKRGGVVVLMEGFFFLGDHFYSVPAGTGRNCAFSMWVLLSGSAPT